MDYPLGRLGYHTISWRPRPAFLIARVIRVGPFLSSQQPRPYNNWSAVLLQSLKALSSPQPFQLLIYLEGPFLDKVASLHVRVATPNAANDHSQKGDLANFER